MDLRITNFGTDAREYTLASGRAGEAKGLLSLLGLLSSTTLCTLLYVFLIPTLSPWIGPAYATWLPLPTAAARHDLLTFLVPFYVVLALFKSSFGGTVVEESVLVIPEIGVQLRKKRRNGSEKFMFIEAKCIRAVVINEAITFADVIYYMAFLVQNEPKMILAFESFRPRVHALQKVFLGTKGLLFPDDSKMTMT
ncbi:hypothetical protein SDRG_12304 [Saprolegnia diclina VS20]|uniref:Phosphatidylinositol N-acetylglucosaminyltransferase subunit H conserved domain-containing protein n=1 Tax=Saprolegnia diclina (strain VS20) TaxID=1156394 RepID=T0PWZ6_SAPDV|nr:hypothetical protein SDRG_12304 [Saprolegnia diclina VS20]EQC30024.1 hypothetical protein SDRG_12304 [Saprolegnia diclina VS20]|eukprot:XP_008616591.1 hypothetical protein SDRG_12304 [Saprolegnia diclina VS20]